MSIGQQRLSSSKRLQAALCAGAIVLSAGLIVPLVFAQATNPTSAPDVIVDASILHTELYDANADGTAESASSIATVVSPSGGAIAARTTYDLTVANISVSGGTGYGYTNGETTISLVNATSNETISGGVTTSYGNGTFVNATYPGVRFEGPGLHLVKAGSSVVAVIFVQPSNELTVTSTPTNFTYSTGSVAYTLNVTNASGPVAGAALSGFNVPGGTTTLADGTRTIVGGLPGAGVFPIQATRTNAGTQTFDGVQLPDVRSNVTVSVGAQALSVALQGSGPTVGTQNLVAIRPTFTDIGQPMLRRTSSSPMRSDWQDPTDYLNVSVATPNGRLVYANLTSPSGVLPVSGVLDLSPYRVCLPSCGSAAPRVFSIDTTSGDLQFAPGDDNGPLSDVWVAGTYRFGFGANTLQPTSSQPEYTGALDVLASAPTLLVNHSPIMPDPAGSVTFFVNASTGGPVGGVSLFVQRNAAPYANLTTNVSGMATLNALSSGNYTVLANASGYADGSDSFSVNQSPIVSRVSIANASGGPLNPVTVPIRLTNFTDLGSITVNLSFNASIVRIENVSVGNAPGANVTWNVNNSTGTLGVLLTTSAMPGPMGNFTLVNVTLKAVGTTGAVSVLNITTVEAVHSDGSAFAVLDEDGTFRSGLLGDVNVDNILDQLDVDLLSKHVVGLPVSLTLANADTNRDGRISGVDAMFLAQYVAGTRTSL